MNHSLEVQVFGNGRPDSVITVERPVFEVGYCRDCRTGNIIATFVDESQSTRSPRRRQQIVVLAGRFFRVTGFDRNDVIAGIARFTEEQLAALGFITKGGMSRVYANKSSLYAQ